MSIEEVRTLVAERQRYDDWLAALEAKRADTPPRVFDRVHGDYVARRAEVIGKLQSHVDELAAIGGELEQRLSDLETRLAGHEEELAEGMLRNLVGEYDNERWDSVRHEVEANIETLGAERSALLAEVEDVRALLASARVAPANTGQPLADSESLVAEALAAPTPVASVVIEETPLVVPAIDEAAIDEFTVVDTSGRAEAPTMPTPAVPVPVPAVDVPFDAAFDTAFDNTVDSTSETSVASVADASADDSLLDIDMQAMVDTPVTKGPSHEEVLADVAALFDTSSIAAVPSPANGDTMRVPADQAEFDDALAMFGEVSGPADQQFVQSLQGIEAEHDAHGAEVSTATASPSAVPPATPTAAPAPNSADPFDDLAFLRSVIDHGGAADAPPAASVGAPASSASSASGEPQKTLRCTECGTMNLPTEWYCERCGGELAAF